MGNFFIIWQIMMTALIPLAEPVFASAKGDAAHIHSLANHHHHSATPHDHKSLQPQHGEYDESAVGTLTSPDTENETLCCVDIGNCVTIFVKELEPVAPATDESYSHRNFLVDRSIPLEILPHPPKL